MYPFTTVYSYFKKVGNVLAYSSFSQNKNINFYLIYTLISKEENQTKKQNICITLLHEAQDIECKYGFLERKYKPILHGSTTDCTAESAHGQTFKRSKINGGKLFSFLDLFVV